MNKAKTFISGLLTGVLTTTSVFFLSTEVKQYLTPSPEFVEAKSQVADSYNVAIDDVALYRHDMESSIWSNILDDSFFSGSTIVYPHYVYTVKTQNKEDILAVVLASPSKEKLEDTKVCGKPVEVYPDVKYEYVTDRREPVYIATINVSGGNDTYSIMEKIDEEINK